METKNIAQEKQEDAVYASFNLRVLATILDVVFSMLLLLPFSAIYSNLASGGPIPDYIIQKIALGQELSSAEIDMLLNSLFYFIAETILFAVVVILFWRNKLATPGKMLLKMQIVDSQTFGKPSTIQFIIRFFASIISCLPFGLGFLWIAFNKRRRAWHDFLAGTVVVRNIITKN